ncbi:DDE-type integrase/transposase/recombinase [Desulfosarcina sp. OttesenSCG-928-B08]|nr:DDE-type integrase/transposase/recombinase [Desulfosarcina sp. OttesenSCG-928-B08]
MEADMITIETVAERIGITPRAVRMRARNEGWAIVSQRIRGGYRYLFPADALPADVRSLVFVRPPDETAGFSGGMAVMSRIQKSKEIRQKALETGLTVYNSLSEKQRAEAEAKFAVLKARDGFLAATRMTKKQGTSLFIKEVQAGAIKLDASVTAALPRRSGKVVISASSIHRWESQYKEMGIGGLAGQYISHSQTAVPDNMALFIQAMITDHPHAAVTSIEAGLKARFVGHDIPGISSIRRYVKKWKADNAGLLLYITNPDEWKDLNQYAVGDASASVFRLNQVWEFDSTPGDLMLTDGRHSIIGVVDVYSRRVRLLVSKTSKASAVAALTRRAILDWGVPEVAKTDNGADYVSRHMVRLFSDLGIKQVLCPPFTPEKKPHIERFFHTFSHSIVEILPGYIGHNVADRKAIESRRTFAQRLMKNGADPVAVTLSSDEFQGLCDRWVNAVYHHNSHSGLGGKTPALVAREWTGEIRRISNERALDMLLCPAPSNNGVRHVSKKGIEVENAYFMAVELVGYEGESVQVRLDHTDFGTIHVFTLDGDFICQAINPDRTGHDRAEMAAKVRAAQNQVIREAAKEARKVAREAGTKAIYEEILKHREAEMASVVELPKPHTEYTTPALEAAAVAVDDVARKLMGPVPAAITEEDEKTAGDVIALAEKKAKPLPATPYERYELLTQALINGEELEDADMAFMKRYEIYLETGKMEQSV